MGAEKNDDDFTVFTAEFGAADYRAVVASGAVSRLEGYDAPPGIVTLPPVGNADVPAEMRGMLGGQAIDLCAAALESGDEEVSDDLRQSAGEWFASVLGFGGSIEVDISFEGDDVVIVAIGDDDPDFSELDVDKLSRHGIVMTSLTGDTFKINRDKFFAAMRARAGKVSVDEFPAGC